MFLTIGLGSLGLLGLFVKFVIAAVLMVAATALFKPSIRQVKKLGRHFLALPALRMPALPAPVEEAPALVAPAQKEAPALVAPAQKEAPALVAPAQKEAPALVAPPPEERKARIIRETLAKFNVPVELIHVFTGPRLKQYCFKRGKRKKPVKLSEITELMGELTFALGESIRMEMANYRGSPYVGIELANDKPTTVMLADVLEGSEKGLTVALGCDVVGNPVTADISEMPHALVAGATGSGKSVFVNGIIASLLLRLGPDQLRFLMIDPKMVELVPYEGIPHLVKPVITDMSKAIEALTWAVGEMERRYHVLAQMGQRHLKGYNEWASRNDAKTLPYIVIVIDELADLMMVAGDQVEALICRIAQKARAIGIHLILATQRPSVDVVTGLIKANVPTRVAFTVTSQVDSRTILDEGGAKSLLGRGDMLYLGSDTARVQRLQGCFVGDEELEELINYWRGEPVVEPLADILSLSPKIAQNEPKSAGEPVRTTIEPVNEPVRQAAEPLNEPVRQAAEPLNEPVRQAAEPLNEPVRQVELPFALPPGLDTPDKIVYWSKAQNWDYIFIIAALLKSFPKISANASARLIGGTTAVIKAEVKRQKELRNV